MPAVPALLMLDPEFMSLERDDRDELESGDDSEEEDLVDEEFGEDVDEDEEG